MSNKSLKKQQIENLRRLVISKYNNQSLSEEKPDAIDEVKRLLSFLIYYDEYENKNYEIVKANITSYLKEDIYQALFGYLKIKDKEGKVIDNENAILAMCLPDEDTFERFVIHKTTTFLDNRNLSFMALYVGYCGWEGFKKRKSISDCFLILEQNQEDLFIKNNVAITPFSLDSNIPIYNNNEGFEIFKKYFEKYNHKIDNEIIKIQKGITTFKDEYLISNKNLSFLRDELNQNQEKIISQIEIFDEKLNYLKNQTIDYLKHPFKKEQFEILEKIFNSNKLNVKNSLEDLQTTQDNINRICYNLGLKIDLSKKEIIQNQNNVAEDIKTSSSKNFRSLKFFGGAIAGLILIILLIKTFIPKSDIQIKGLFDEKFDGFEFKDSTTFKLLVMPFNRDRVSNLNSKASIEDQFLRRFNKIRKRDSLNIEIAFLKTDSPPSDEFDIQPILDEYKPNMIIWGNYEENINDETKIAINYSISSEISLSLGIPKNMETNLTSINSMESIRNGKLQGDIDNIIFWIVANYHFKKNEFNKSYLALNKMKENKGFEYHYNVLMYLVCKKRKDETNSKIFFSLAVESIKNHPTKDLIKKYNELASILLFEKNMINSLFYFTKSLKINPNDNYALKSVGMILTYEKEYEMAEKIFLKSIKLNDKDAHTWYLLGITYVYNNKNEEAGTAFQIAAKLNPKLKSFFKEFIKNKNLRISDANKVFKHNF
ncbi:protein of unknown function [Tenacibaculum sp. 190524A02b]|uniref:tetratricopeptide repeat protein n=1 Tax=Tenacibaculum vairaonense TaxID=3137860 RepID=UPI0032B2CA93